MDIKEVKEKVRYYNKEQINFTDYCLTKMEERQVSKDIVFSCLADNEILFVESQKVPYKGQTEERYKIIFRLSTKYSLIIVVSFGESILNVINVIKTSKDLEKKWRKRISK